MKRTTINLCHTEISLPMPGGPHYLRGTMKRALIGVVAVMAVGACRPTTGVAVPEPISDVPSRVPLPEVPLVQGPLEPRVVYPVQNQMIQSRDSNFIFGSVGNGLASLAINGQPVQVWPNGAFLGFVANPAPTEFPQYTLVASLGADTIRMSLPVRVPGMPVPDSLRDRQVPPAPPNVVTDTTPTWVVLGDSAMAHSDTDRVIIGRPGPNSVYRWFLLPGTRVQMTGRFPGFARVRLDSALEIWVAADDARKLSADTARPRRVAQNARVRSAPEWVDLVIPIAERPAFFIEEREQSLELTLYDTRGNSDVISYPTADSLVRLVEWVQERTDRARYTLHLSRPPFGYLVLYENGAFVLRVRRPPVVAAPAARSALAGLTITVDAGHPPGGANGPTGLYEGDAALAVAFRLDSILRSRGATVHMTRTTPDAVDLAMRPVMARRAGSHAFVSIHYNAYGDGVNPFRMPNGTEVYYYRPHSEPLARAVQSNLVAYQPLPDQGIHFRSLAVVRTPWMPAILAEGGFMMIPEQENAMRTAPFQERYARAIADGLESYFRTVRH
jgi:N-acetylmuramoyl-L-alanine amidase